MHGRIYELSSEPIPEDEFVTEAAFYDHWFCGQIADYVSGDIDYEEEKLYFLNRLKSSGTAFIHFDEPTAIRFSDRFKLQHFLPRFEEFKKELSIMSAVSLEAFIGSDLDMKMHRLENDFEDKFDNYIYLCGELLTFDSFVRCLEPEKQYFLGGIIDYHY